MTYVRFLNIIKKTSRIFTFILGVVMVEYCVLNPQNSGEGYGVQIVRRVFDITFNRGAVEELCRRCNEAQLDPVHFDDVLEDFLSEQL